MAEIESPVLLAMQSLSWLRVMMASYRPGPMSEHPARRPRGWRAPGEGPAGLGEVMFAGVKGGCGRMPAALKDDDEQT
jgi:hypothetical protein